MSERQLFLISANKSRLSGQPWPDDDYDVRDGSPDGPVIGRIYKQDFSPSGTPWFWGLLMYPAMAADRGTAETREAAMAALKAQWIARRGWEKSVSARTVRHATAAHMPGEAEMAETSKP